MSQLVANRFLSVFARSEQTGEFRLYAEGSVNNLSGISDQMTLGVLGSFSPSNTTYGQFRYRI